MANKDIPNGFLPHGVALRERKYVAGGAVYKGDPVKQDNTGRIVVAAAGDPLMGIAASTQATAGQSVLVWDHPDQMFIAQSDSADINALTDLNLNYDIVAASSTLFKLSRAEIDGSSGATNSNLPIKVLAEAEVVGESLTAGTNSKLICKINNHVLNGGTGTVGI